MKIIDADKVKEEYPDRKSLNQVMDNAKPMSIADVLQNVVDDMCTNYCKIPYKYSKGEWDKMLDSNNTPECDNCPLMKLV